jgi:hypothetical protein
LESAQVQGRRDNGTTAHASSVSLLMRGRPG